MRVSLVYDILMFWYGQNMYEKGKQISWNQGQHYEFLLDIPKELKDVYLMFLGNKRLLFKPMPCF